MNFSKLSYRAEIDGLRAIAVIAVIFYHAQMTLWGDDWFKGGFIGVDIFFVISGYLITRIILAELQSTGSFNFLNFYERRTRRIMPMLFLVIFVSTPFAWQRLLPLDFVEYAESVLASLFFGSNFFFYFNTTEYGSDSALLKPFLHTWSLGVEEQFYLFFPVFAVLAFKFFRTHFFSVLIVLSLLSLVFAEIMETRNADLNFYLPFSRFWELAAGSLLAYRELNIKTVRDSFGWRLVPTFGLMLIFYSILFFDSQTRHPGLSTIIPILGVALIIAFSSTNEMTGKLLSSKPFVSVGLLSYSAYLWHFPLFAFARIGGEALTNFDRWSIITLTFTLSIASYYAVEKPFRRRIKQKDFMGLLVSCFALVCISAAYVIKNKDNTTQLSLSFAPHIIESAQPSYLFGDKGCTAPDALTHNSTIFCVFGSSEKEGLDFLLLGDSHAMHAQPLLHKIGIQYDLKGAFGGNSGCPPLLGIYPYRGKPHPNEQSQKCFAFNQDGLDLVKSQKIKTVILVARWDYYVDGADTGSWNNISDTSLMIGQIEDARNFYKQGIEKTFAEYQQLGTRMIVLLQVPHQNTNIKRFLEGLIKTGGSKQRAIKFEEGIADGVLRKDHLSRQLIASSSWLALSHDENSDQLIIIDPTDAFCGMDRCPYISEEFSLYTDFDHASAQGFERLEKQFVHALGLEMHRYK